MVKHIVMWKLKEETEGKTKKENAEIIKSSLEGLKNKISEIVEIEVGINWNDSDAAYDVVLYSVFNTREDLDSYQVNPHHVEAAGYIKKVVESRIVADYDK